MMWSMTGKGAIGPSTAAARCTPPGDYILRNPSAPSTRSWVLALETISAAALRLEPRVTRGSAQPPSDPIRCNGLPTCYAYFFFSRIIEFSAWWCLTGRYYTSAKI